MKKTLLAIAFTTIGATGFCEGNQQEVVADAQQPTTYKSSNMQHDRADEMYGFRFQGEALFWQTTLDNLQYAGSSSNPTATVVFPTSLSKQHISFDWNWGFRLDAGYRFCDREWGFDLQYTQLHSKAINQVTAPPGGSVFVPYNNLMSSFGATYATTANSHFNNKFYALDGLIERKYDVNTHVEFYPAFGVKGVWIRQSQRVTFTGGNVGAGLTFVDKAKNHFSGAGPKISLASKWMMGSGFSFYNKLGASLLFGNSDVDAHQDYSLGANFKASATHDFNRTIPALEALLGLEYLYDFEEVAQSLGINIGFDGQYYFNQYVFEPTTVLTDYAGLGFYGISFGASWYF
ncbi:MAG: hypothetical protein HY860_05225 [Chlamydiales bacterium]|nr:hypothetical protein [Chlamydiales bacterium]